MAFKKIPAKNKQGYKWEYVKDGPADPVTGKRQQIRRRGDTKKEAEDKVNEIIERLEGGMNVRKAKTLAFEEVAEDWIATYSKTGVKANTVRVRSKEIKMLKRYYARAPITQITHNMHQKVLNDLDDQDYARTTIEGVHVTAGMIFKHAVKNKLRLDNPTTGAVIPTPLITVEEIENSTIEEKYLNREELTQILNASIEHGLEGDAERFHLLAFSGMRPGELCALKWSDLDFEKREVRITKTIYNPDFNMRKYELTPPKTKAGIRTFTVDEMIIKLMQAYKEKWGALDQANPPEHNANFIFRHENGFPYLPKNLHNRMTRLLKHTTITKNASPHIFRHTYISMLAEAEVDLKTTMQRVGHDDAKTTLKIYTHVTELMQRNADERIHIAFKDILEKPLNKPDPQDL